MTDPIETMRTALDILDDFLELTGTTYAGPDPKTFREALSALRENALDLSEVPEGWRFVGMRPHRSGLEVWLLNLQEDARIITIGGEGPTPRAALSAAIERAKQS